MRKTENLYPLTHPQKRILYTEKFYPNTSIANNDCTVRLDEKVDYGLLERAIHTVLHRNEGLRLRLVDVEDEVKQYVCGYKETKIDFMDFSIPEGKEKFENWTRAQTSTPFELNDSDLHYFAMLRLPDGTGGYYCKIHHILADGWALGLIGERIKEAYTALKDEAPLSCEMKPSYIEYIRSEEEYKKSGKFTANKNFWSEKFKAVPKAASFTQNDCSSIKSRRKVLTIEAELARQIHRFCEESQFSAYSLFMSVLCIHLSKITLEEDITVGTLFHNRLSQRDKDTMGMYTNTVPVRIFVDSSKDAGAFIQALSNELKFVMVNQKYPYDLLLQDVREKQTGVGNLFNVALSYENFIESYINEEDFEWYYNGYEPFHMTVRILNYKEDRILMEFDYREELFSETEIEQIHTTFITIMKSIISNPEKLLSEIDLLSDGEKDRLLREFNDTAAEYPRDKTIQELFEEQAAKTPDNIALVSGNRRLTYRQLDEKTNRLARSLRERGVRNNSIVVIMTERSMEMILGILSIIKAGGAYLPIDPDYPAERIQYMLEDSGAILLVTKGGIVEKYGFSGEIIDMENPEFYSEDASHLEIINSPNDLAYVLYTSGSTGRPKGTMIEHSSVVNRLNWIQNKYPIDESDVILFKTPYTFDVSVWELYWWACTGASVCLLPPGGEKDPGEIIEAAEKNGVTIMNFVPSVLTAFLEYVEERGCEKRLSSLRQVFSNGEALKPQQVDRFNRLLNRQSGARLYNMYGPTEATVNVTYFDCPTDKVSEIIPIGKPIDNVKIYILSETNKLLPVGMSGELCIAGSGVARGYLNRPDLTAEKFVPDPFETEGRMYRTGDLARWLPDGNIEFLGRMDHQVKIRGVRVELGEIENQLLEYADVKEAVVTVKADKKGTQHLCAYLVSDKNLVIPEIKDYLSLKLPYYMVPSYLLQIPQFPLTSSGKTDRKALPSPQFKSESIYEAPRNELEMVMAEVFGEALRADKLGIHDNFFDLGGNSITFIHIIPRLLKKGVKVNISSIFDHPTIAELVKHVERTSDCGTENQGIITGKVPLLPNRSILDIRKNDLHHWNICMLLEVYPMPEIKIIEQITRSLLNHHDGLRLRLYKEGTSWKQYIESPRDELPVTAIDFSGIPEHIQKQFIENTAAELQRELSLKEKPFHMIAFYLGDDRPGRLMPLMHHSLADGYSYTVFMQDLATAFVQSVKKENIILPPKSTSIKRWAEFLNEYAQSESLKNELEYWGTLPEEVKPIPLDFPEEMENNIFKFEKFVEEYLLTEEETALLFGSILDQNIQINDILVAALAIAIRAWTGATGLLIDFTCNGRYPLAEDIDLSRTIGWLAFLIPVYFDFSDASCGLDILDRVKTGLHGIPKGGLGYGCLRYLCKGPEIHRRMNRIPHPQVTFNYFQEEDNTGDSAGSLYDFGPAYIREAKESIGPGEGDNINRGRLLDFVVEYLDNRLYFRLHYGSKIHSRETMKRLAGFYKEGLHMLMEQLTNR